MPYIKNDRRADVDSYLANPVAGSILAPQDCGELNYALTMTCLRARSPNGYPLGNVIEQVQRIIFDYLSDPNKPLRYQRINDAAGAAECAAFELYRRVPTRRYEIQILRQCMLKAYGEIAVAYEKTKIRENGDIEEYGDHR